MEDNNNVTWHTNMTYENKMLEKERRNNSYHNVNRNNDLLVLIFYFLQVSLNKKKLANDNLNMDIRKEEINKLKIACNLIKHNQKSPRSILSISTYYDI